jgi:DNA-binding response OmpR family regulator
MTTETARLQPFDASRTQRPLRTVAVVSRNPHARMLDAVLDAGDYDVVFIESVDGAYSQIKRSTPDVVILCLDLDDAGCFQILSMLNMDSATSGIPIITYVAQPRMTSRSEHSFEVERDILPEPIILSMN